MKRIFFASILVAVAFASGAGWAANDYSLVYATVDLSGGPVAGAANPTEDLVSLDLQAPACAESASYTIASLLRYPEARNAVSNWTLYR